MAQRSPSRQMDQFIMRMPDGMRDRLKASASANRRSMNAEVIVILERHLAETETAGESAKTAPTV